MDFGIFFVKTKWNSTGDVGSFGETMFCRSSSWNGRRAVAEVGEVDDIEL